MQRAGVSRRLAQRAIELELQNTSEKISRVGHIGGYVVLGAGIEIRLAARDRRSHALIFQAKVPPGFVVIGRRNFTREYLPPPLIDHQSEGQKCDFVERLLEQQRNVGVGGGHLVQQSDRLQVLGRDRQRDGVPDRFVEAV